MLNHDSDNQSGGAAPAAVTVSRRYHGLDLLRSLALLLGIVFHAAMPVLTPEYLGLTAKDVSVEAQAAPILGFFMSWTQIWRMPAFFLLAGFFAQMVMMRKGPRAFLADRAVRIFGVLAVFCCIIALLSGESPFVLGHLWFLWFLGLMCLFAGLLWYLPFQYMDKLAAWFSSSLSTMLMLIIPVTLASILGRTGVSAGVPQTVFDLQLGAFIYFWVFFLIGQMLWIGRARVDDLARLPIFGLLITLGTLLFVPTVLLLKSGVFGQHAIGFHVVASATTLMLVLGLVGITHALANKPNPVISFAVRVAYPVYVFHIWPSIAISAALLSIGFGPLVTVVSSVILTILTCLIAYLLFVRYTPLDWLFSGYAKAWFKWPWRANG